MTAFPTEQLHDELQHDSTLPSELIPYRDIIARALIDGTPSDELRAQWIERIDHEALSLDASGSADWSPEEHGALNEGAPSGTASLIRAVLADDVTWDAMAADAKRRVVLAPSLYGVESRSRQMRRLKLARNLLAGLLLPFPEGSTENLTRNVGGRLALTLIALKAMKRESLGSAWDVQISWNELAEAAGWSRDTTRRTLPLLVDEGLITLKTGKATRVKMLTPSKARLIKSAEHFESIIALMLGTPDPIADLIRMAEHPTWGSNGPLSHQHWLLLLLGRVKQNPATFGFRPIILTRLQRDLDELGIDELTETRSLRRLVASEADDPITTEAPTPIDTDSRSMESILRECVAEHVGSDRALLDSPARTEAIVGLSAAVASRVVAGHDTEAREVLLGILREPPLSLGNSFSEWLVARAFEL